ncbi:MAG: DUF2188 domain-containing protein [Cetobacterium sp.]
MGKNQHVTYNSDLKKWRVIGAGNSKATHLTDTKTEAVELAIGICKNQESELTVHNKDGEISYKNSYGNDPCPPKDKN